MGIDVHTTQILCVLCEGILFGGFFVLCCITLYHLSRLQAPRPRVILLTVASVMLILNTTHMVINVIRSIRILDITTPNRLQGDYSDLDLPLFIAKTAIFWMQSTLADGVLMWRCYVIISKKRLFIMPLPALLMISGFIIGTYCFVKWLISPAGTTLTLQLGPWISAYFVLTMVINVYCTGAIVGWCAYTTAMSQAGWRAVLPVIAALVESGALYTAGIVAYLGAQIAKNNGQYPMVDMLPSLAGIVYCLIILQIKFQCGTSRGYTSAAEPGADCMLTQAYDIEINVSMDQSYSGNAGPSDVAGKKSLILNRPAS